MDGFGHFHPSTVKVKTILIIGQFTFFGNQTTQFDDPALITTVNLFKSSDKPIHSITES